MLPGISSVTYIYFFYGLSFFFLGSSILFKETRSSELKIAKSLWLLAGFGFTHGTHEWLELYLHLEKTLMSQGEIYILKVTTVIAVIVSFVFLLQFGLSLIISTKNGRNLKKSLYGVPAVLFFIWIIYLWYHGFSTDLQFFKRADISARYTFGFIGAITTAYGLRVFSIDVKSLSSDVTKKLFYAGIVFALYGILAGIVPSRTVFPLIQLHVEVFRGICAVLITFFIIKALNVFDIEMNKNIEERLKRIAQSEKLVSLGHLAAGVAHEINNPLANISLNLQLLRDVFGNTNDSQVTNRLNLIEKNVKKASNIAKELLQFSHDTDSDVKPVNMNRLIRGALTLMQHEFRDINIHQELSVVPEIMGDPVKLEQILINILNNACEAMKPYDEICIESSNDNEWVKIKIADSGAGIPEENLSKVFDPFFTTKEVGKGTGLGLSICYGIINQHKGEETLKLKVKWVRAQ